MTPAAFERLRTRAAAPRHSALSVYPFWASSSPLCASSSAAREGLPRTPLEEALQRCRFAMAEAREEGVAEEAVWPSSASLPEAESSPAPALSYAGTNNRQWRTERWRPIGLCALSWAKTALRSAPGTSPAGRARQELLPENVSGTMCPSRAGFRNRLYHRAIAPSGRSAPNRCPNPRAWC